MKLRNKLMLSTGISFALFLVALIIAIIGMQNTKARFERFVDVDQALLRAESEMYTQGLQMGQALRNIVMDATNQAAYANLNNAATAFERARSRAKDLAQGDEAAVRMLDNIGQIRSRQKSMQDYVIEQAQADRRDAAISAIASEETPLWRQIRGLLIKSIETRTQEVETAKADMTRFTNQMLLLSAVLAVAALTLGGLMMVWLTRSVMRQLGGEPDYAARIARDISSGNFATSVHLRQGDKSSLMYVMHSMQLALSQTVRDIRQAAHEIDSASGEIASGNADLSSRTESQAANLEQTASAMEELTSTVRHNADNAAQADKLAASASRVAQQGGEAVQGMVATMASIKESSSKIVDIISVIDGIAFQTNILALNAAVEAARAGSQGRGFAVVASEVRTLAQRSAAAAQEIKTLIDDSVNRVEEGDRQAEEAGATMSQVVTAIHEVATLMTEITGATNEQSVGIDEIGQAVVQLDGVTQQNAALVEQAAAAAASLEDQARALAHAVSRFKLAETITIDAAAPTSGLVSSVGHSLEHAA